MNIRELNPDRPKTLQEAISLAGGRPLLSQFCRNLGFKIYSNQWANWSRANHIPEGWRPVVECVIENQKHIVPNMVYLSGFFSPRNHRKRDNKNREYPNLSMVRAIRSRFNSNENFLRQMRLRYDLKINRNAFYNWLDLGVIQNDRVRYFLQSKEGFTIEEIGEWDGVVRDVPQSKEGTEIVGFKREDILEQQRIKREKWNEAKRKSRAKIDRHTREFTKIQKDIQDLDAQYGKPVDPQTLSAMLEDAE